MAGMELINGVYYTPEDLARKREREAAAKARREAEARETANVIGRAQVEISDDRIRAVLTELLEPVIEAVEDLEGRVAAIENPAPNEGSDTPDGATPEGDGSAASEAGSTVSDEVPAKAAPKKAVKK